MGLSRSRFPISSDEAYRRVGDDTLKRLKATFERFSSNNSLLPQATFLRDVFGDGIPPKFAEAMYRGFHGQQKGISFNDLLKGLVLITEGTRDEKARFLAMLVCSEEGFIMKVNLQKLIADCDIHPGGEDLDSLFNQVRDTNSQDGYTGIICRRPDSKEAWCTSEQFVEWIKTHPHLASFSTWLLEDRGEDSGRMRVTADPDPPTFYQTLAKKFGVSDKDVMDLEKAYWALKASNSKFDLDTFREIISPPLPTQLCDSLFELFDVNCDGHIDLSEMIRGVAMCCRRHTDEKIKLCFTLLDTNKDSLLDGSELTAAMEVLTVLREENTPSAEREEQRTVEEDQERHFSLLAEEALSGFATDKDQGLTADDFVRWGREDGVGQSLVNTMLQVIFEVCHVRLGLRPSSTSDEASIVKGYMVRFLNKKRKKRGTCVYLIAAEWFNTWRLYADYEIPDHPLERLRQFQPLSHTAKQSSRSQASTYSGRSPRRSHPDNICPKVEVAPAPGNGSVVEVTRGVVLVEGEEDEEYSHVITTEPVTSAGEECLPTTSSSITTSSSDQSNDRTVLNPVDNRPLLEAETGHFKKVISLTNEGGRLTRDKELKEFRDYYVLPEEVWKALVVWHGSANYSGGPSLPRTVVDENGNIELYPIQFQIYKHTNYPPASKTSKSPWASIATWLGSIGIGSFGASSEATPSPALGLPGEPIIPHRVLYYKASFDENTTIQQVCEQVQKVLHMKPDDLRVYDFQNEEQPELLEDEMKTLNELEFEDGRKLLVETRNKDNSWPEELIALMKEVRNSENKEAEPKPKPQGPRVTSGATGLSNLGNTCFMNSALQCISNVQPLTNYFIEKEHLVEINKQNPLGMSGVMAKRYADLVQDLWSGHSKSITPLKFRFTVARYAPRFSSFQQQDAQELLAFVLDGIHEDLNRVREKPYRELPDSEDRPDQVVADEAWKYHKERNDSIVVDLFHGQLKSVVQCRECDMKSVKFDPFTFLSLPLPMDSATNMEIIVVRLDGSQPVRYCLRQGMDDKYRRVKENISALTDIPVSQFVLVDVYGGIVRSFPQDNQKVSMGLSGWLYAFEVPSPPLIRVSSGSSTPEDLAMTSDEEEEDSPEGDDRKEGEERPIETENRSPIAVASRISDDQEVVEDELDSDEKTDFIAGKRLSSQEAFSPPATESSEPPAVEATEALETAPATQKATSSPSHIPPPSHFSPQMHGFLFAVHRRTLRVDQYFVSTQRTRPVLFSIPMVVPCTSTTPARIIYQTIWDQLKRLVIPDPPNRESEDETTSSKTYPFQLKLVSRDGYYCSQCLWYRFCRGCLVECNDRPLTCSVLYLAIDWEESFLHLKYQGALERPIEDKSMENMKFEDNKPVNLQECFQAFSKPEELGEEEYWYCSKCKEHRPARKTLELWRLPKVLIVHLKRFQFHNGRWVKSQRPVQFPLSDLDPIDYMRREGEEREMDQHTATPPVMVDDDAPGRGLEPPEVTKGLVHAVEVHESERENEVVEDQEQDSLQLVEEAKGEKVMDGDSAVEEIKEETTSKVEVEDKENEAAEEESGEKSSTVDEDSEEVSKKEETEDSSAMVTDRCDEEELSGQQAPPAENGVGGTCQGISPEAGSSEDTPTVYRLFSITCHSGVMGGGHYTSFAKNPNGKWYYYNDSSCKETNDERVLSESPYILFYEQDGLQQHYSDFRAQIQGKKQDIGFTEDDREFEQSLKNLAGKQPQKKSSTCNQQ